MSNLNDIEQKNYDSVSDMLTDKLDELEDAFKENLELNNKLQINTMNLVSRVSELKGYIATLSTEIRDTKNAIANNNYENLNDSINRLTRILSFSTEREPKRVRKVMTEAPDSTTGVTITESSLEFDDGGIEDISLDFNSLLNEATSAELEDSLRNSFNNASDNDTVIFDESSDSINTIVPEESENDDVTDVIKPVSIIDDELEEDTGVDNAETTTDSGVKNVKPVNDVEITKDTTATNVETTETSVSNPTPAEKATVVNTKSVASGSVLALLRNSRIR